MSGTFIYQNRMGSRALSVFILALSVLVTYCVRVASASSVLALVTFAGSLFFLSALTIPLNRALYFKEGSYCFHEDDSVTIQTDKTYTFHKNQVKGVGCDPVEDRRSRSVRMYKISILPDLEKDKKQQPFELYSDNVMTDNQEAERSVQAFLEFGALLKHWMYH